MVSTPTFQCPPTLSVSAACDAAPAKTSWYCSVPKIAKISMTPKPNPKSPTRFTTNALVAASFADFRSYQCPINK